MTNGTTDAEKLAALLDGGLDDAGRDEVMTRLASSDSLFEAFADAVVVTRELEGAQAEIATTALRRARARWWHGREVRSLAAAAGLATIFAVPLWFGWTDEREISPAAFVTLLADGAPALDQQRLASGWPVRRSADAPHDRALALRLGAELVWLDLALRAGDMARVRGSASVIDSLLDTVAAGAPLAAIYRSVAEGPDRPISELRPLLARAASAVVRLVDEDMVNMGAWIETARLAAIRRDAGFFAAPETRALLASASANEALTDAARSALTEISEVIASGTPRWADLQEALDALPRVLASG
jgi:hypothetical protein